MRLDDLRFLAKKLRGSLAQLTHVPRVLTLVWATARGLFLAWVVLLLVQGLLPVAAVVLTRPLVDHLARVVATRGAWDHLLPTLVLGALMVGVLLLAEVLQGVSGWIHEAQSEHVQDHISHLIHEQSTAVDLAFYESADYHDHLHRAREDAVIGRPLALLESLGSLLQNGITCLAMAAVLMEFGVWLPLVLFASTLPALYVVLHYDLRFHRWWRRTTPDRRWAWYHEQVLTGSEYAAELRLFGLGDHYRSGYQALRRRLRAEHLGLVGEQALARLGAGAASVLLSGAALAWMVWRAVLGSATLGDLALFQQSFSRGQGLIRALLGDVGRTYQNSLFLGNLFEFLDLQPSIADPPGPTPAPAVVREGIRFRGVTFHYPGSERVALRDFDLTVPAGQTVAIVGANGAGKSTLVKLLCRFYDPQAGCIELDGIDLRHLAVADLRRLISVLFQAPVAYQATAGENIALGDLAAAPAAAEIEAAARQAGAHEVIAPLPRGYDTLLGKRFADGTELSGGEWQRIALARAFLRRAQVIVLDEPTSFMDPWAEADWFDRFRSLAGGRTALIVTHRLTIARRADVIHVMHAGRVVESGSHAELLARGGPYAESWAAQIRPGAGRAEPAIGPRFATSAVDHGGLDGGPAPEVLST